MKNLIIVIGALCIAFNTLIGLIVSVYPPFNFLMVDLSIAITVGFVWWLADSALSSGIKIGLSSWFLFTGLVRLICMAVMPQTLENNILLLVAMGVLIFEFACAAVAWYADKK